MNNRPGVSLYEVNLVTFLVYWFLERVGTLNQLTPVFMVGNRNVGFLVMRLVVFLVLWFILWYLDRNLQPGWVKGMRSHQGVAKGFDVFVLLICLALMATALGTGMTNMLYLWLMTALTGLAAIISLITGRERPQVAGDADIEIMRQELAEDETADGLDETQAADDVAPESDAFGEEATLRDAMPESEPVTATGDS